MRARTADSSFGNEAELETGWDPETEKCSLLIHAPYTIALSLLAVRRRQVYATCR